MLTVLEALERISTDLCFDEGLRQDLADEYTRVSAYPLFAKYAVDELTYTLVRGAVEWNTFKRRLPPKQQMEYLEGFDPWLVIWIHQQIEFCNGSQPLHTTEHLYKAYADILHYKGHLLLAKLRQQLSEGGSK